VFQAFSIEAPQRIAAIRHQATEEKRKKKKEKTQGTTAAGGVSATAHLEKKKRKLGAKGSASSKRSCIANILFGPSSPLKAKGDSKDAADMEASPLAASSVTSTPPASVEPKESAGGSGGLPGLDVSDQETESDEDGGRHVDIVGSPVGGAKSCDLVISKTVLCPRKAPSSSHSTSSSSSSSCESEKKTSSAEDDDQKKTRPPSCTRPIEGLPRPLLL
jgi:hypothetical protein